LLCETSEDEEKPWEAWEILEAWENSLAWAYSAACAKL